MSSLPSYRLLPDFRPQLFSPSTLDGIHWHGERPATHSESAAKAIPLDPCVDQDVIQFTRSFAL
jgi:hypothetical protein